MSKTDWCTFILTPIKSKNLIQKYLSVRGVLFFCIWITRKQEGNKELTPTYRPKVLGHFLSNILMNTITDNQSQSFHIKTTIAARGVLTSKDLPRTWMILIPGLSLTLNCKRDKPQRFLL